MVETWADGTPGLIVLPNGTRARGRSLNLALPDGQTPTFGLYLTSSAGVTEWEQRWVRWNDFWLPSDPDDAVDALRDAACRTATERVEVACNGGIGRTGTGLAALCVLSGLDVGAAVAYVRERYHPRAVEVPWQKRFLRQVHLSQDPGCDLGFRRR